MRNFWFHVKAYSVLVVTMFWILVPFGLVWWLTNYMSPESFGEKLAIVCLNVVIFSGACVLSFAMWTVSMTTLYSPEFTQELRAYAIKDTEEDDAARKIVEKTDKFIEELDKLNDPT